MLSYTIVSQAEFPAPHVDVELSHTAENGICLKINGVAVLDLNREGYLVRRLCRSEVNRTHSSGLRFTLSGRIMLAEED